MFVNLLALESFVRAGCIDSGDGHEGGRSAIGQEAADGDYLDRDDDVERRWQWKM